MRFSMLIVVFLVLLTVFSAYSVVYTQGLATESVSTVTVGTYGLQGSYDYVASLAPNQVYNTTTLRMGQGSLFVALTKTINVTYTGTVYLSEPGSASLDTSYLVTVSGGALNKTLGDTIQTTSETGTGTVVYSKSFLLNVTQIGALVKRIETELQYPIPSYMVQIRPATTGSLVEGGRTVPLDFVAPLNLSLSNGVITPSGVMHLYQGNITDNVILTYGRTYTYRDLSYALLSASIVLLGLSTYYVLRVEKKQQIGNEDTMAKTTRLYSEVIARTTRLPIGVSQVPMEKWEDLVKIADTLGKPILRFDQEEAGGTRYVFCVLDGETRYYYEFEPVRPGVEPAAP